jgi:outer membrane protein TolC
MLRRIVKASSYAHLVSLAFFGLIAGCASFGLNADSDLAPPARVTNAWNPPRSVNLSALNAGQFNSHEPALQILRGQAHDLPELVDIALKTNPKTRTAWYAAQVADAQLGQSKADNYPKIAGDADAGYFKLPVQFPGQTLVVRNEAFLPEIKVSYDLLDFGRSRAAERGAREQLIAANFVFNRSIQDVVFNTEKSYYVLSAATASVAAAEANLKLARTSLDAIGERHRVGLATKRQILLAKQVEAQAVYDLENAKSMVHDAESSLCEAIGVASDVPIVVQGLEHQNVPNDLSGDVEALINDAVKKRPDIAAQIARIRASDDAIDRAESEFYPEVGISGNYGQVIWSYTVNEGHTQDLNQPFYGALLTLRWNLFTGFDRYYALRKATAQRDEAREELKALEIEVTAAVWKAYYDFFSARKKYDASEALVAASEESYNANLESHQHGLSVITDLIGAERDLMAARYTLVQNKAELLVSSSALAHAVGAESASEAASH